jgi:hypothetical protein
VLVCGVVVVGCLICVLVFIVRLCSSTIVIVSFLCKEKKNICTFFFACSHSVEVNTYEMYIKDLNVEIYFVCSLGVFKQLVIEIWLSPITYMIIKWKFICLVYEVKVRGDFKNPPKIYV